MVEKASEIVEEIASHRQRLGQDLTDLESRVRQTTNWRTYYEQHPLWFVGTAFGGGLLLSGLLSGQRPISRKSDASNHNVGLKSAISEVLDNIKIALIGFGVAKGKEVLADVMPGFQEHLRRTEHFEPRSGPIA